MRFPQQPAPLRRSTRAFTLVEMLVVVGILGLLAALLFPALSSAIMNGKRTASASNMRQIGLAMMSYAAENNMRLPETSHTAQYGKTWIFELAHYLDNVDKVRICPADPQGPDRLLNNGTSYTLNSFLFVPQIDPFGQLIGEPTNDLKRIPTLSKTLMAFICADTVGTGAGNDHTHSYNWTSWAAVLYDIAPDRFTTKRNADRTAGTSNYLYADGHVETHTALEIKNRIESGDNIATIR